MAIGLETSIPLVAALHHSDEAKRCLAVNLLGLMRVPGTAKEIARLLDDEDEIVRRSAAEALLRFAEDVPDLVSLLVEDLTVTPEAIGHQYWASISLGRLGRKAVAAIDALRAVVNGPETRYRPAAVWALRRIERQCADDSP